MGVCVFVCVGGGGKGGGRVAKILKRRRVGNIVGSA